MELTLAAATLAAALTSTAFVLCLMTVRWERTWDGRSLMAVSVGTAGLAWLALLKRWDELHADIDWWARLAPPLALAWAIVAAVFAWRIVAFVRGRRRD